MSEDEQKNKEVLKTFDMYHFFSRKDVILAIILILLLLGFVLYKSLSVPTVI